MQKSVLSTSAELYEESNASWASGNQLVELARVKCTSHTIYCDSMRLLLYTMYVFVAFMNYGAISVCLFID